MKSTIYERVSSELNREFPRKVRTAVVFGLTSLANRIADVADAIAPEEPNQRTNPDSKR